MSTTATEVWWLHTYYGSVNQQFDIFISPDVYGPRYESTGVPLPGERQLTTHPADDYNPQLNFDSSKIVFVSERDGPPEIYTMDTDGSDLTRLTDDGGTNYAPVWSPDGSQIVFISRRMGTPHVFRMQADGSEIIQLSNGANSYASPDWSPTGTHLVWVEITIDPETEIQSRKLQILDLGTQSVVDLTTSLQFVSRPRWSLDGTRIAFDYDSDGDYFNDLAIYNLVTGTTKIYQATNFYDHIVEGWTPSGDLLFKSVEYSLNDNQLQILGIYSQLLEWPEDPELQDDPNFDDYYYVSTFLNIPDEYQNESYGIHIRPADIYAPTSHITPLPEFSYAPSVLLRWQGEDKGVAGVKAFDIEYKTADDPIWRSLANETEQTVQGLPTDLAGTIYFRSRAIDYAENEEDFTAAPDGDVETTLYKGLLSGRITDNRNQPINRLPFPLKPIDEPTTYGAMYTNSNGVYQLYFKEQNLTQFQNGVVTNVGEALSRDMVELSAPSFLVNGDFESGTTGWSMDGGKRLVNPSEIYAGTGTLQLESTCLTLCQSNTITFELNTDFVPLVNETPIVLAQPSGQIDLFVKEQHRSWSPLSGWSEPFPVEGLSTEAPPLYDSLGNLHIVANGIHQMKLADGAWQRPTRLSGSGLPRAFAASDGELHLIAPTGCASANCQGLIYRTFSMEAGWSEAEAIHSEGIDEYSFNYAIAVTADGTVHVVWQKYRPWPLSDTAYLQHQYKTPGNAWSEPVPILEAASSAQKLDLVAMGKHIHLLVDVNGEKLSQILLSSGTWSAAQPVSHAGNSDVFVDRMNGLHLLNISSFQSQSFEYRYGYKPIANNLPWQWDDTRRLEFDVDLYSEYGSPIRTPTMTSTGIPYLVFATAQNELTIWRGQTATEDTISTLAQSVSIPEDMHEPTLAFMQRMMNLPTDTKSYLAVDVTDALTTTTVMSTTNNTAWSLAWADLSPWAGQAVTLTWSLHQAAGEPIAAVNIDQVSVAPWTTPSVATIEPAQVDAGLSETITLSGENFLDLPIVKLGDREIADFAVVDDSTVQLTLPADIEPGRYVITLGNSTGPKTISEQTLQVGEAIFLPLLR